MEKAKRKKPLERLSTAKKRTKFLAAYAKAGSIIHAARLVKVDSYRQPSRTPPLNY